MNCLAGCELRDILSELDLTVQDLFADGNGNGMQKPQIVATYDYVDEKGALLYQVVRMDPKEFRQRRPSGSGWDWSLGNARRVLYRLPRVVAEVGSSGTVVVVEGEKDVLNLERVGKVATTCSGGAGRWQGEFSRVLAGAGRVAVIADDDEPGRKHAFRIGGSLLLAGLPRERLGLFLPVGKDVSAHLGAGLLLSALRPLGEEP